MVNVLVTRFCVTPLLMSRSATFFFAHARAQLFLWLVTNVTRIESLGNINKIGAVFQMAAAVCIGIVCLACSSARSPASCTVGETINLTGLEDRPTNTAWIGLSGLLFALYSFSGFEGGAHIAEETKDAETAAPLVRFVSVLQHCSHSFLSPSAAASSSSASSFSLSARELDLSQKLI